MSLFYPKVIIIAILIHVVLFLAALNFEEVIRKAKCRKNFQNHTTVRISAAKKTIRFWHISANISAAKVNVALINVFMVSSTAFSQVNLLKPTYLRYISLEIFSIFNSENINFNTYLHRCQSLYWLE